ncbi:MAG TPA: endonuclease/exonuclease/phosphatase, partial [Chroococcales cyanobacterium]
VFAVAGEEKTITVFNTHLDYNSEKARELSVMLICDRISHLDLAESYLFLTGDFNASSDELPRKTLQHPLSNSINLIDALTGVELEHQLSFHDFTGKAFVAIDTIYYDSRVHLRQATLNTEQWQGIWPSDHFPVVAEFVCDR